MTAGAGPAPGHKGNSPARGRDFGDFVRLALNAAADQVEPCTDGLIPIRARILARVPARAPSSAPPEDRPTMGGMTEQAETIRTAILTVDDDPGVSRAVARDLRRRYGERDRIVRAEAGADALEA